LFDAALLLSRAGSARRRIDVAVRIKIIDKFIPQIPL